MTDALTLLHRRPERRREDDPYPAFVLFDFLGTGRIVRSLDRLGMDETGFSRFLG